jgi:hypothetical protein
MVQPETPATPSLQNFDFPTFNPQAEKPIRVAYCHLFTQNLTLNPEAKTPKPLT